MNRFSSISNAIKPLAKETAKVKNIIIKEKDKMSETVREKVEDVSKKMEDKAKVMKNNVNEYLKESGKNEYPKMTDIEEDGKHFEKSPAEKVLSTIPQWDQEETPETELDKGPVDQHGKETNYPDKL